MDRSAVLRTLKEAEAALRSQGVAHAALFGSVARGEDRPESGIDILVEIAPEAPSTSSATCRSFSSSRTFPGRANVASRAGLKPLVRPSAERDAIYAF